MVDQPVEGALTVRRWRRWSRLWWWPGLVDILVDVAQLCDGLAVAHGQAIRDAARVPVAEHLCLHQRVNGVFLVPGHLVEQVSGREQQADALIIRDVGDSHVTQLELRNDLLHRQPLAMGG